MFGVSGGEWWGRRRRLKLGVLFAVFGRGVDMSRRVLFVGGCVYPRSLHSVGASAVFCWRR